MHVLILGSGGREHALAWRVRQAPSVSRVSVAPGNAGTDAEPGIENVAIDPLDFAALTDFASSNDAALTIVGPETPLVEGVTEHFQRHGLRCFGPSQAAARLEGSKAFTKDFLARHDIPTAAYRSFSELEPALDWLRQRPLPVVIKADGLASGKGVVIASERGEAEETVRDMLSGDRFGDAGTRVVIEDCLEGEEASFIAMVDGRNVLPLATSQDHKARDDGDRGPNTGGMGAYSPAPAVSDAVHERIMQRIITPTVEGMAAEGTPYVGFLYAGLMIGADGEVNVIEYNCRFGDPEAQPIMMRLRSDLAELCDAALDGRLDRCRADWDPRAAVGVVLASGGYPGSYQKGCVIRGLEDVRESAHGKIFHAGTAREGNEVVTSGGRVLCATALGDTVTRARERAYALADGIDWEGIYYRRDIAHRAVAREQR